MRVIGRLLTVALLLGSAAVLIVWLAAAVSKALPPANSDAVDYRLTDSSFVYPLAPDRTVTFRFSRPQSSARLITHADLQPGAPGAAYSLVVHALDPGGRTVMRREIFLRSIVLYSRASNGRIVPQTFYADSSFTPTASDITLIEFERPVAELRLQPGNFEPGVARLVARVQEQRPISERQLQAGWQRLSPREQSRIAEGNAFPPDMLTAEERRNLLINRWYPVGPTGVQGFDYQRTILYERRTSAHRTLRGSGVGAVRGN